MLKALAKMKSENWGGLAGMAGSLIVMAAGDPESVVSTACFLVSETTFARKGHTSLGYSLGCAGFSFGDGLLCFSHATAGNPALRLTMGIMAVIWAIGALRYPLEQAKHTKIANVIQPLVGSSALLFRLPVLYTATFTGEHVNTVMIACNLLWGAADILMGRIQDLVKRRKS